MQLSAEKIWNLAQEQLRSKLSKDTFSMWFAPLRACALDGDHVMLEAPNEFSEVWLKDNYTSLLQDAFAIAAGRQLQVRFKIAPGGTQITTSAAVAAPVKMKSVELAHERVSGGGEIHFNPKNTFDTFVVGNNNNFAYAAALAVAQAPGKSYNPLFVYGGVGLGKTHLLHAIGQHASNARKSARVAYVSSEKFTNEYIDGIQNNQLAKFRKKYRQTDVLLIDDIQFLAGKERIQEEFFHTFNALHEGHKQIVLTCDRPASEIQGLEHRLVSRFEWGLVTDLQPPDVEMRLAILHTFNALHEAHKQIVLTCDRPASEIQGLEHRLVSRFEWGLVTHLQPPDVEMRLAILQKKAQLMGVTLPEDILNFLANRIRTNVRRLEGALIRVASYASLTGRKLNVEVVEGLLREILHEEGRFSISIEVIQKKVAEHFDIRLADMTSKRRPENIAFPRPQE